MRKLSANVIVDVSGPVCGIRLNRPGKLNALNDDVRRELYEALQGVSEDMSVRVVVLSGEGRAFSAGADLVAGAIAAGRDRSWAERRHVFGGWQRLLDLLESIPQVTVASVHGHCIGGAALLAACCDLRIGADDLKVSIPELAIGIPLTWGGVPRLAREIGLPMARDLVMTGRTLDASEAKDCGFVQRVVPAGELEAGTRAVVDELLVMPAGPLGMTRAMFSALSKEKVSVAGWADADLLSWSSREPEGHQAAADYMQRLRRDPGSG